MLFSGQPRRSCAHNLLRDSGDRAGVAACACSSSSFTMLALSSLSKSTRYVAMLYTGVDLLHRGDVTACSRVITGSTRVAWVSITAQPRRSSPTRSSGSRRATRRRCIVSVLVLLGLRRRVDLGARAARPRRGGGLVSDADPHRRSPVEVVRPGHRPERRHRQRAAGHHRAARPERRRQEHVHEARSPASSSRARARCSVLGEPIWGNPDAVLPHRLLSRAGRVLRPDDRARVGHGARAAERPRREARPRRPPSAR